MDTIYESYQDILASNKFEALMESGPLPELVNWINSESITEQIAILPAASDPIMAKALGVPLKALYSPGTFGLPTIEALNKFLILALHYLGLAVVSILSGAAIAQLIGYIFIGLAKLIDKNVQWHQSFW